MVLTPFPEVDAVMRDLATNARSVFADGLVGVYIEGSFALGAGDMFSDVDFFVVTASPMDPQQEQAIRAFHDELPTRAQYWARHVEGSYLPVTDLLDLATAYSDWLFVDHGHREMSWDTHGNDMVHRWVLHEHGIAVVGPPARDISAPVPPDSLRDEALRQLPGERKGLLDWLDLGVAWSQRYIVLDYCRILFTLTTGAVASKRRALEWAADSLDPAWRELVLRARDERVRGFDLHDVPSPRTIEQTMAFIDYAETWRP